MAFKKHRMASTHITCLCFHGKQINFQSWLTITIHIKDTYHKLKINSPSFVSCSHTLPVDEVCRATKGGHHRCAQHRCKVPAWPARKVQGLGLFSGNLWCPARPRKISGPCTFRGCSMVWQTAKQDIRYTQFNTILADTFQNIPWKDMLPKIWFSMLSLIWF